MRLGIEHYYDSEQMSIRFVMSVGKKTVTATGGSVLLMTGSDSTQACKLSNQLGVLCGRRFSANRDPLSETSRMKGRSQPRGIGI
jgi:hypothetical protein